MKKTSMATILLVEDEESLAIGLEYNLTEEGYVVVRAADGLKALELYDAHSPDLVILDIMIPRMDGFEVAQAIRKSSPQVPILILTARASISDKLLGLETGADDYLTKPFNLDELQLRIKGMLRRKAWYREYRAELKEISFGHNHVNFENLECRTGNNSFRMTQLEASLLKYLVSNAGRVVPREELLGKVWNVNTDTETRTVDNFIMRLRKYFEPNPVRPTFIKSIRGAGYVFTQE